MQVRITLFRYNWKILIDFYYVPPSTYRRMNGCWGNVWCFVQELNFGFSFNCTDELNLCLRGLAADHVKINCWSNNDKVLTVIDLQQRSNQQPIRLLVLVRWILYSRSNLIPLCELLLGGLSSFIIKVSRIYEYLVSSILNDWQNHWFNLFVKNFLLETIYLI